METDDIHASIAELRRGSVFSLGSILIGILFLAGTIYYSATRLAPLEKEVQTKREEIAELEAKRAELARLASVADNQAGPATSAKQELEGWVYLGRMSEKGNWAPKSDRIDSATTPTAVTSGAVITARSNASLVDDIDLPENPPSTSRNLEPDFLIRPGAELKALEVRKQDSIGNGKLLWVKVRVKPENLLQIGK